MRKRLALASLIVLAGFALSCSSADKPAEPAAAAITGPAYSDPKAVDLPGLHNVVAFGDGFWSGSQPEGDEGFQTLRRMGVRTVISVDGGEPEVARAKKLGLRYIHLPISYGGISKERQAELARATRDAREKGNVYIHCHHGKHRSAGAAAATAVSLGWDQPAHAVERMKVSGTAPGYTGLYACAADATTMTTAEINAVSASFPEVSPPPGFVKAMVEVDERSEHLKAIEGAGWVTPSDHPDLVPVAEAGRLADLFRLSAESDSAAGRPADFAERLRKDAQLLQEIEDGLKEPAPDKAALSAKYKLLAASCKDCHAKYRD